MTKLRLNYSYFFVSILSFCLSFNANLEAQVWDKVREKSTLLLPSWVEELIQNEEPVWSEEVLISWYGRRFHGRRTASGERYSQHEMTCASRNLPFGTILEVKNIHNDTVVRLRVNDRGPYNYRRTFDVSKAAAKKLGIVRRGVGKVIYRIVYSPNKN